MMPDNKKNPPFIPLDVENTDETREPTGEDLRFNDDNDSFELASETADGEYQHPEPYDTAAPGGEDNNSTYDEANPYTPGEYRDKGSELKGELEGLDETIADDRLAQLDEADERLANTAEDEREELDDEGYPLKDDAGGPHNPILENPREYNEEAGEEDDDEPSVFE